MLSLVFAALILLFIEITLYSSIKILVIGFLLKNYKMRNENEKIVIQIRTKRVLLLFLPTVWLMFLIACNSKAQVPSVMPKVETAKGIWINEKHHKLLKKTGTVNSANDKVPYSVLHIEAGDAENSLVITESIYGLVEPSGSLFFELNEGKHEFVETKQVANKNRIVVDSVKHRAVLKFKLYNEDRNTYEAIRYVKLADRVATNFQAIPEVYVNQATISGSYVCFNNAGRVLAKDVSFSGGGNINGLPDFLNYRVETYYDEMWTNFDCDVIELRTKDYYTGTAPPSYMAVIRYKNMIKLYAISPNDINSKLKFRARNLKYILVPKN